MAKTTASQDAETADAGTGADPTPPSVQADSTTATADTDARVRAWVAGHLSNGHLARNTECWNELQAALPALVDIINA